MILKGFQPCSQAVRPGVRPGDANVTDIRQLRYESSDEIFYQLDFSEDGNWISLPMKRKESTRIIAEQVSLHFDKIEN